MATLKTTYYQQVSVMNVTQKNGRINTIWYGKLVNFTFFSNYFFYSLRDEKYEPIYTYNDEYLRFFVRKSIKGGSYSALNQ